VKVPEPFTGPGRRFAYDDVNTKLEGGGRRRRTYDTERTKGATAGERLAFGQVRDEGDVHGDGALLELDDRKFKKKKAAKNVAGTKTGKRLEFSILEDDENSRSLETPLEKKTEKEGNRTRGGAN